MSYIIQPWYSIQIILQVPTQIIIYTLFLRIIFPIPPYHKINTFPVPDISERKLFFLGFLSYSLNRRKKLNFRAIVSNRVKNMPLVVSFLFFLSKASKFYLALKVYHINYTYIPVIFYLLK